MASSGQFKRVANRRGHLFLPDFCSVNTLLPLILVAELLVLVFELIRVPIPEFDWQHFGLASFYVQWLVVLSAACLCQLRPSLQKYPAATAAVLSYLLVLLLTALVCIGAQWLLAMTIQPLDGYWLARDMIITAVIAGVAIRYFYLQSQLRWRTQAESQARIAALQARIRPHFLFNSLNSIASLIAVDAQRAEQAVEDLADLFRASLVEQEGPVTWQQELTLCQRYMAIEALRLGGRLQQNWQVETVPASLPFPALALQPLLENAVYHGIQHLPEGGEVAIRAQLEGRRFSVEVRNPVSDQGNRSHGHQMATQNIRHRIQALFGDNADLKLSLQGQEFVARLSYVLPENYVLSKDNVLSGNDKHQVTS